MLSRLRIRQKLAVLLVIPLIAVAVVMALFSVDRVAQARAYGATAEIALAARDTGALIQVLQQERLLALGYLAVDSLERSALVGQSQTAIADTARLAGQPRTAAIIARAKPQLDALDRLRGEIVARNSRPESVYRAFRNAISALMDSIGLANPNVADPEGLRELLALDALMRSNEEASSAGAIVVSAAPGSGLSRVLLDSVLTADALYLQRFSALAAPDQISLVDTIEQGEVAKRLRAQAYSGDLGATPRTASEIAVALTAALTYTSLRRLAQDRVARETALDAQEDASRAGVTTAAGVAGASLLFGLVVLLAVTVSRAISQPLSRLGRAVGAVAELSRAELVRVADSEALEVVPPELASVEVDSKDEIGDLATAVNRVQSTAAMLIERQATARANVAVMFANVSRRTQNLVGRQLSIIEELGRQERDPAMRERIAALEHLTTRLRRSADSLMVVSGTIDQQLHTVPSRLTDVIDAALVEIEGYRNVEIVEPVPDVAVPAELANDLRLLLAELLENATNFTPPGSSVRVGASFERGPDAGSFAQDCTIAVVDHGLGMSPTRMEEENRRLVERERLDVAPTRMLGLFVVGRLARRHGLTVRLDASPGRGVTALVRIPARYLAPGTVPATPALSMVPPVAVAALESASRSGPFPWLSRSGPAAIGAAPAIGSAPVTVGPLPHRGPGSTLRGVEPVTGAPISAVPVTGAPVSGVPTSGAPRVRDPEAERQWVNSYLSGSARGALEVQGGPRSEPQTGSRDDETVRADDDFAHEPDHRPTAVERHP